MTESLEGPVSAESRSRPRCWLTRALHISHAAPSPHLLFCLTPSASHSGRPLLFSKVAPSPQSGEIFDRFFCTTPQFHTQAHHKAVIPTPQPRQDKAIQQNTTTTTHATATKQPSAAPAKNKRIASFFRHPYSTLQIMLSLINQTFFGPPWPAPAYLRPPSPAPHPMAHHAQSG